MKNLLFLFIATLLFLSCSSNDENSPPEEQNTELKIKKFTGISFDANGNPDGHLIEYYFDENGKKTKDHIIDVFGDYDWNYTYNNLGQVMNKSRTYLNYPTDIVEEYVYST